MILIPLDESVINTVTYNCFSTCDISNSANNVVDGSDSNVAPFDNTCCFTPTSTSSGYGTDTTSCTPCKSRYGLIRLWLYQYMYI